jgi:hypothetical protein
MATHPSPSLYQTINQVGIRDSNIAVPNVFLTHFGCKVKALIEMEVTLFHEEKRAIIYSEVCRTITGVEFGRKETNLSLSSALPSSSEGSSVKTANLIDLSEPEELTLSGTA